MDIIEEDKTRNLTILTLMQTTLTRGFESAGWALENAVSEFRTAGTESKFERQNDRCRLTVGATFIEIRLSPDATRFDIQMNGFLKEAVVAVFNTNRLARQSDQAPVVDSYSLVEQYIKRLYRR